MKREIKFRAWDKPHKKMITDFSFIQFNPNGLECEKWVIVKIVGGLHFIETDKCNGVLMQYTGLKDKNGKEIYEGDILENPNYPKDEWERCEVRWHEEFARFGLDFYSPYGGEGYTGREQHIDCFVNAGCYVIGNIYENKIHEIKNREC